MDGISSGSNSTGPPSGGASEFLSNLPSRGFFSSIVPSSHPGGMRVYICDHDTSPPEDQLIKTNQANILIRSLMLKNSKGDASSKEGKSTSASQSKKRIADKALDKASGKKALSSAQPSSSHAFSPSTQDKDMLSLTVERLRALLKEKGLSTKGKKDELIARLRAANE